MLSILSGFSLTTKIFLIIGVFAAGMYSGQTLRGWYEDSVDLKIEKISDEFIGKYENNEAGKAAILETRLGELRANERIIEREKLKIVDRPVYHNICLDDDGLRLIERARTGQAEAAKPAD